MTATTAYSKIDFEKLAETLRALPPKPPKAFKINSARKLVAALFEEIGILRDKGYAFSDIQEILAKRKITMTPNTLKKYWFEEKKLRTEPSKSKRKRAKAKAS